MYKRVLPKLQLASLQQQIKSSPCSEPSLDRKLWGVLSSGTQPQPHLEPTSAASGSTWTQALLPLQFSLSWDFHQTVIFPSPACTAGEIPEPALHILLGFSLFHLPLKETRQSSSPQPETNPFSSFLSRPKKTPNKQRNNCLPSSLLKPSGAVWR